MTGLFSRLIVPYNSGINSIETIILITNNIIFIGHLNCDVGCIKHEPTRLELSPFKNRAFWIVKTTINKKAFKI